MEEKGGDGRPHTAGGGGTAKSRSVKVRPQQQEDEEMAVHTTHEFKQSKTPMREKPLAKALSPDGKPSGIGGTVQRKKKEERKVGKKKSPEKIIY